jgi:hypothetical protein
VELPADAGEAQIDQPGRGALVRRDHDVVGLEIAVDDAGEMQCVHGVSGLDPERDDLAPR